MLKILEELCLLDGVAGYEEEVRAAIADMCRPYADEMYVDVMGNLIVRKKGKRHDGPSLMITAHMDEVGFLVSHIEENGSLRIDACGEFDPRVIPARTVRVGDRKIQGVIGSRPNHLLTKEERKKVLPIESLFVDIGVQSAAEAEKLVGVGDQVVMESDFVRFGTEGRYIKAKAIDDRIGCVMMVRLIQRELPLDVTFAFTVQEEVGLRGGAAAGFHINPDIALILEGTFCSDLPGETNKAGAVRVGGGPVISSMDALTIYDRRLFEGCRALAVNNRLPWQIRNAPGSSTDAGMIQQQKDGARTACIAVPVSQIHTSSSVACVMDMENTLTLIDLFLQALAEGSIV